MKQEPNGGEKKKLREENLSPNGTSCFWKQYMETEKERELKVSMHDDSQEQSGTGIRIWPRESKAENKPCS